MLARNVPFIRQDVKRMYASIALLESATELHHGIHAMYGAAIGRSRENDKLAGSDPAAN